MLMTVRFLLRADARVVRGVCGTAAAIRLQRLPATSITDITAPTRVRRSQPPSAKTSEEIVAKLIYSLFFIVL
jgi:hypothetical protein